MNALRFEVRNQAEPISFFEVSGPSLMRKYHGKGNCVRVTLKLVDKKVLSILGESEKMLKALFDLATLMKPSVSL